MQIHLDPGNDIAESSIELWQDALKKGIRLFLEQTALAHNVISEEHVLETPQRVVKAYAEFFAGCEVDPASFLKTKFEDGVYDQMIHKEVHFVSFCSHPDTNI